MDHSLRMTARAIRSMTIITIRTILLRIILAKKPKTVRTKEKK